MIVLSYLHVFLSYILRCAICTSPLTFLPSLHAPPNMFTDANTQTNQNQNKKIMEPTSGRSRKPASPWTTSFKKFPRDFATSAQTGEAAAATPPAPAPTEGLFFPRGTETATTTTDPSNEEEPLARATARVAEKTRAWQMWKGEKREDSSQPPPPPLLRSLITPL